MQRFRFPSLFIGRSERRGSLELASVVLFLQVVQVDGRGLSQVHQLLIAIGLRGAKELRVVHYRVVHRVEVVQDEVLLDI